MATDGAITFCIFETLICVPIIWGLIAANRKTKCDLEDSNRRERNSWSKLLNCEKQIKEMSQEIADTPRKIEVAVKERIAQSPKLDLFLQQRDPTLREGFFDSERTRHIAMAFIENTLDDFIQKTNYWSSRTEERIKALRSRLIKTESENIGLRGELANLRELFPNLTEYVDITTEDECAKKETDSVVRKLPENWFSLSDCQRNQFRLDRYVASRKKTTWQIGRDFELYVGHCYRTHGWQVQQFGIERGLEDLGRDLICTKDGKTAIVQCKCWSAGKTIHEKHINQLFGTAVEFAVKNRIDVEALRVYDLFPEMLAKANIVPVFATTAHLSETAKAFALLLGVKVKTVAPGWETTFPRIKCNIGKDGSKIYHLPFDQQYDTTIIEPEKGECYALTCAEAEAKGFRRAWRFHGR